MKHVFFGSLMNKPLSITTPTGEGPKVHSLIGVALAPTLPPALALVAGVQRVPGWDVHMAVPLGVAEVL